MTYKKIDTNHSEIVDGLRKEGCEVLSLASLGHGVPDLLVLSNGKLYLLEVKYMKRKLTPCQLVLKEKWNSVWNTVRTLEEALRTVGKI